MSAPDLTERVARAICRQWNIDDGYADNETLRRSIEMGMWRNHLEQAQAAISAIEASETHVVAPVEATEEMIAVGWVSGPRFAYLAMIQAIPKVTP